MCDDEKNLYVDDICVACGAPVAEGDQICSECKKQLEEQGKKMFEDMHLHR